MEHEVFVPVPAERLRATLADPARVARAVPGLQQDVGGEPGSGRLKVRIASHSITYRGSVRVSAREDGSYAVEGEATEARGSGVVTFALVLRVADTEGGATLAFAGTATADGRVAELPRTAVDAAVTRLLNRFAEGLGADGAAEAEPDAVAPQKPTPEPVEPTAEPVEPTHPVESAEPLGTPETKKPAESDEAVGSPEPEELTEPDEVAEPAEPEEAVAPLEPVTPMDSLEPPAEAAHARRTMIGRSAEEVDHAPPRGRYAPVPAPQTIAPNSTLRWAAPAAALVVASAIVVGRALRKRR
ncbi:carbon monoxide dehydrogenase subunit G [Streptomyces adustus]|uniref:Carbon monoxide dehydrogenase subunit G n=1 Tax=Streptomyces adustus TaxID=1609272 RepID=A0A5N8VD68_9ACTN|nr:SRPBCC domain-containing protein [Streptomyces adustus]MPY31915.1 carbon monoxide dehydrogenase subunit G [Streptomyces adustus]